MGDIDRRGFETFVKTEDLGPGFDTQFRIKVRQRFIKEKQLGLTDNRTPNGDTLLLSARKCTRFAGKQRGDVKQFGSIVDCCANFGSRHVLGL